MVKDGRSLTWAGRLDLRLILFGVRVEEVWRRVLAALYLALEGVQTLDVLFLKRTGRAARRAHVQAGGQLPPLLVLVHLVGDKRKEAAQETENTTAASQQLQSCLFWSVLFASHSNGVWPYLGEAANLFDGHVESEEIERFAAHGGQVVHAHRLLLCEGQVSVHPHLPLWFWAKLVQTSNLLIGDGRRAWLLKGRWKKFKRCKQKVLMSNNSIMWTVDWTFTFLDSGLGVPSTLLFIFWAGFTLSMPNSVLGAIPECWEVIRRGFKNQRLQVY